MPDLSLERSLSASHGDPIVGVDEVGRGPWAGPVTACAVVLPHLDHETAGLPRAVYDAIDDSKSLKVSLRESLADTLKDLVLHGFGEASVSEIDEMNILQASLLAMRRATAALPAAPVAALVDGNRDPKLLCQTQLVVKGDSRSVSIAVASILAKTRRDRLMVGLADQHPGYGWERNMGYGTKAHKEGLHQHGVTIHHRKSFAPIKALLNADTTG